MFFVIYGLSNIDDIFNRDFKAKFGVSSSFEETLFNEDESYIYFSDFKFSKESLVENSHKFNSSEIKALSSALDLLSLKTVSALKLLKSRISYLKADNVYLKAVYDEKLSEHATIDNVIDYIISGDTSSRMLSKTFNAINNCSDEGSFIRLDNDNLFVLKSDNYSLTKRSDAFKITFNKPYQIDSLLFKPIVSNNDVFDVFIETSDQFIHSYSDLNISEVKNIVIQKKCLSISINGNGISNLISLPCIITCRDTSDDSSFFGIYTYSIKNPSAEEVSFKLVLPKGTSAYTIAKNSYLTSNDVIKLFVNNNDPDSEFISQLDPVEPINFSAYDLLFYTRCSTSFVKKPILLEG